MKKIFINDNYATEVRIERTSAEIEQDRRPCQCCLLANIRLLGVRRLRMLKYTNQQSIYMYEKKKKNSIQKTDYFHKPSVFRCFKKNFTTLLRSFTTN